MKLIIALTFFAFFISCKEQIDSDPKPLSNETADNAELAEIYKSDQADRMSSTIDWSEVSQRDSDRRARVYELLDSNKVITAKDYRHSAMVFQHGGDSTSYRMAVELMEKSLEIDPSSDKWLFAAATDRYLLSIGKPQIYGTQYQRKNSSDPWSLGEIDTTQITDTERIEHGVETLAQQREKVKAMNSKQLSELLSSGKSIDEIVAFIQAENTADSEYDVSERGINSFGYMLMRDGKKEDALKVFKLNTEMYPDGFNTHDSYGECLMELGREKEAVEAYKRSLELNPKNNTAREIIEKYKEEL